MQLLMRVCRSKEYDVIDVRVGEELNLVVFKYYSGLLTLEVTEEAKKRDQNRRGRIKQSGSTEMDGWIDGGGWGINYVAGEGIMQKRCGCRVFAGSINADRPRV